MQSNTTGLDKAINSDYNNQASNLVQSTSPTPQRAGDIKSENNLKMQLHKKTNQSKR